MSENQTNLDEDESCGQTDDEQARAALMVEFLRITDAPCPVCGYNLRHLPHNTCPECGQYFKLSIGAVSHRFGLFVLLIAPFLMSAGLGLLMLILILDERPPLFLWWPYVVVGIGLLDGVCVVLLYRFRSRFFRDGTPQTFLICLAWLINIGVYALLSAAVR